MGHTLSLPQQGGGEGKKGILHLMNGPLLKNSDAEILTADNLR